MNEGLFQACAQRKQAAETVDLASWQSMSAARLLPIRTEKSFTPTQPLSSEGAMSSSTHIPKIDTHPMLILIPMSSMSNKFGSNTSGLSCLRISAPNPLPANSYVKTPSLIDYNEETAARSPPSDLLLEEARICEILRKNPHPNIAEYLGCVVNGNRISGLCFVKYNATLATLVNQKIRGDFRLDKDRYLKKYWSGAFDIFTSWTWSTTIWILQT